MNDMDLLQTNMIEAWQERAKRAGEIIKCALLAPALTDPMYARALGHHYQYAQQQAGYWMMCGGR